MGNAVFDRACLIARARRLMTNGQFTRGYRLIKDMQELDFIAALQMLATDETTFKKIFQIRERHGAKETEPTVRVLARAAKAGDSDAVDLLGARILENPIGDC
jgi:hypothetical protein